VDLAASYAACRKIVRQANSSFPLAFRLLSRPKRDAMNAIYAFARLADDVVDQPAALRPRFHSLFNHGLQRALAGEYKHEILPALYDTIQRYAIPHEYLFDLVSGIEMDLEPVRFETFLDLRTYCYRVASVVGLACVRIWGVRPGASFEFAEGPAEAAGIAFQLTNILRDLAEDEARGRDYLPREDRERYSNRTDLIRFEAARARDFYRESAALDRILTNEGRAVFGVMCGTYRELLERIARDPEAVFRKRVRVPKWRKAMIFLSAWPVKWGLR
jgi:phytoene synthase